MVQMLSLPLLLSVFRGGSVYGTCWFGLRVGSKHFAEGVCLFSCVSYLSLRVCAELAAVPPILKAFLLGAICLLLTRVERNTRTSHCFRLFVAWWFIACVLA